MGSSESPLGRIAGAVACHATGPAGLPGHLSPATSTLLLSAAARQLEVTYGVAVITMIQLAVHLSFPLPSGHIRPDLRQFGL